MEECENEEHQDRIINNFLEENGTELHGEVEEISIKTENDDLKYRNITENETKNNMNTNEEVIDECSDDTPTAMMEDYINNNLGDTNKNNFNEVNQIGLDDEEGEETKYVENEGEIHRDITENETKSNWYTFKIY